MICSLPGGIPGSAATNQATTLVGMSVECSSGWRTESFALLSVGVS